MRLIDSITPLLLDSKLFYDPQRIQPIEKKKRKKNLTHMGLKIGQGGTLDPLADGVLGEWECAIARVVVLRSKQDVHEGGYEEE